MKLLIVTQYFPPEMGAPQSRLSELAVGLKELGWEVGVVTAMPNYPTGKIFKEFRGKFSLQDTLNSIPVKRYWVYPSNSPRTFPRLVNMLSFSFTVLFSIFYVFRFRPKYILVESPPLVLSFSVFLISRLVGSRMIMNVSDLWPLTAKELGAIGDGFLYRRIEGLEKFLYRRAFLCTGQSQEIIDHIEKRVPGKTFLFRNGVDTKRFETETENKSEQVRLVYAGLLGVAQGILSICQNVPFSRLGVEFHIYGSGAEEDEIKDFLRENPDSNIFLHKPVKRDEVPGILKSFDGALIPLTRRIYGAVPSKIYEAMAAGLPILFSGEGEGSDIIRKQKVGWISASNDFITLRQNIIEFAENRKKREQFSFNGIESAKQIFDRKIQIQNFYDYLVNKP